MPSEAASNNYFRLDKFAIFVALRMSARSAQSADTSTCCMSGIFRVGFDRESDDVRHRNGASYMVATDLATADWLGITDGSILGLW